MPKREMPSLQYLAYHMAGMKKKEKAGLLGNILSKVVSSSLATAAAGILAIIIGLSAIYALHPYISLPALIAIIAFFIMASEKAAPASLQKTIAASFAVAIFLLMFAVPSGELGGGKCPDRTVVGGPLQVRLKYFTSPFCIECILFDKNVEEAQKISGGFTVDYYDIRYCKRQADYYGFPGTPCYAFLSANGTLVKRCGVMPAEEIAQQVALLSSKPG